MKKLRFSTILALFVVMILVLVGCKDNSTNDNEQVSDSDVQVDVDTENDSTNEEEANDQSDVDSDVDDDSEKKDTDSEAKEDADAEEDADSEEKEDADAEKDSDVDNTEEEDSDVEDEAKEEADSDKETNTDSDKNSDSSSSDSDKNSSSNSESSDKNNSSNSSSSDKNNNSSSSSSDKNNNSSSSSSDKNNNSSSSSSDKGNNSNSSNSDKDNSSKEDSEEDTTVNPEGEEILGEGSKEQPYMEIPGDDRTVTTVKIPAGKSLYYAIYRVGGMYFTIDSADAYVVCDGVRYDAYNGRVSFKVENVLASDAVLFEIGNNGSSAQSFTISFSNPLGTYANPVKVDKMGKDIEVSLAEGNEVGYYYSYTAKKKGTIRFYMTASEDAIMYVTNNRNSAQRTTEADVLVDENGNEYIEIEVNKGDKLSINVGAKPTRRGKYPAIDISWIGKYE